MDRLGIDIGSKTIKVVLLSGDDGSVLHQDYLRHRSRVKSRLVRVLRDMLWNCGPREVRVTVTGSAGMRVAELFGIPHVQEVVALKLAVEKRVPGCDCILEMGGEDTKLVYVTGTPEQRMNTVCAGGTGGFIDMMASLMGTRVELMSSLARKATTTYPIASRCAVFAKSDVRPLLNSGAEREDIARSVLEAVCTQAIAGLSAGRPLSGTVVLCGGPFSRIPALKDAFVRVSGLAEQDVIVPEDAHLLVAHGAALSLQASAPLTLRQLVDRVTDARFFSEEGIKRLAPLFADRADYDTFAQRHETCQVPQVNLADASPNLFVGIDAGSTTMKMAVVDETGALCGYEYNWNHGDVTKSLPWMLVSQLRNINSTWAGDKVVRRSCIVGYGEEFCRAAYRIDMGEVETIAHLRAAMEIDPDVDFVLDIGGQDIKCFYVRDGKIDDIVLNEACSSGCGSLFDDIARSMNKTKETFVDEALFAKSPVDLGTRCSTFMDSRVKHALKDGVESGDIAAGVAYATARNALYKVVRRPDFASVGKHVVVQGGAFANDALLRAFELETGCAVKRPDLSEIMGAWGAALLARDEWLAYRRSDPQRAMRVKSSLVDVDELRALRVLREKARCSQCANTCELAVTRFAGGDGTDERVFVMGNKCAKGARVLGAAGHDAPAPPNMFEVKRSLLDSFGQPQEADTPAEGAPVIGIPRALALHDSLPFWATFLRGLGLRVCSTGASDDALFRGGMGAIPSEGACYPSKLMYGHIARLRASGADYAFVPRCGSRTVADALAGKRQDALLLECPLVENAAELATSNMPAASLPPHGLISPDLRHATTAAQVADEALRALEDAGVAVDATRMESALAAAMRAQHGFEDALSRTRASIARRIDAGEFEGALVLGHAYHADLGICHGVDLLLGKMGYAVLDSVQGKGESDIARAPRSAAEARYAECERLSAEIEASANRPQLQCVILRSFGCGIDAMAADDAHGKLRADGRVYAELKLDQVVDLAAVRIRLRSLAYAMKRERSQVGTGATWQLMDDAQAQRIAAACEAYEQRTAVGELGARGGAAHIKRATRFIRRNAKRPAVPDAIETRADNAADESSEKTLLMWKLGYALGKSSADETGIVFETRGESLHFESWSEVENFLVEHLAEVDRRDACVADLEKLGYSFVGFRPTLRGTEACIGFVRVGEVEWFSTWGAAEEFAKTAEAREGTADAIRPGNPAPQPPPPPGQPADAAENGAHGNWDAASRYADELRKRAAARESA